MRALLISITVVLVLVLACAHKAAEPTPDEKLQAYVFERNIDDVWPLARAVLEAHHFEVMPSNGTYRMETAPKARHHYPDGGAAPETGGYQEKSGAWTAAPPGYGKAGMERGGNGMGGGSHGGGGPAGGGTQHVLAVPERLVVEGEALDDTHSRVTIYREIAGGEPVSQFAPDLERELIKRSQLGPDAG